jgi:hypothetical protein
VPAEGNKKLLKLAKVQTRREIRRIAPEDKNDKTYREEEYYVVEPYVDR